MERQNRIAVALLFILMMFLLRHKIVIVQAAETENNMVSASFAEEPELEDMLYFELCTNQEIQQQENFDKDDLRFEQPEANKTYIQQVMTHKQILYDVQVANGLRFTALSCVAVNDLYMLKWQIENISGEVRLLGESSMTVNGQECHAYIDGGLIGRVLLPDESAIGMCAVHTMDITTAECILGLTYFETNIDEEDIPEDRSNPIEIDEENAEVICQDDFVVTVEHDMEPSVLSLEQAQEHEWLGSVLRLEKMDLDISGGTITMMRIFASEEEALKNNPAGDNGWDFMMMDGQDEEHNYWFQSSSGYIDDMPVQLDDGRYGYRFNREIDFLNYLPEILNLVPRQLDEEGIIQSHWDAAFTFEISNGA